MKCPKCNKTMIDCSTLGYDECLCPACKKRFTPDGIELTKKNNPTELMKKVMKDKFKKGGKKKRVVTRQDELIKALLVFATAASKDLETHIKFFRTHGCIEASSRGDRKIQEDIFKNLEEIEDNPNNIKIRLKNLNQLKLLFNL